MLSPPQCLGDTQAASVETNLFCLILQGFFPTRSRHGTKGRGVLTLPCLPTTEHIDIAGLRHGLKTGGGK